MKRFLDKASNLNPFLPSKATTSSESTDVDEDPVLSAHPNVVDAGHKPTTMGSAIGIHGVRVGHSIPPKLTVPPIPHPLPHDHLALLAHQDGLLIRPHIVQVGESGIEDEKSIVEPSSYVRVVWGKDVRIEEVEGGLGCDGQEIKWESSVIVYGIVGILELFSDSYLLVVSARAEVGYLFDPSRMIHRVKGVTPIPLNEERARVAINTLASRNVVLSQASLGHTEESGPTSDQDTVRDSGADSSLSINVSPRVQFALDTDVKLMTPVADQTFPVNAGQDDNDDQFQVPLSRRSSSSDLSGYSSESSSTTSPVAKTVASKLSFWSRLSRRAAAPTSPVVSQTDQESLMQQESIGYEEPQVIKEVIDEQESGPAETLKNILSATAPPPATPAEKHSELEDKVLRECIKEFTRGGMYFSYAFDITRSLQHKQELMTTQAYESEAALKGEDSREKAPTVVQHTEGGYANPLSEPSSTLPLWRRVDRQFWWNEWMSRPFIDAGLHPYVLPIMQGFFQISGFAIPADPTTHDEDVAVQYIIISRRSRDRAGLRFQRRGIDEDAHVANFVETETIMRVHRLDVDNIFSYVQIRGSIPLYWTQTSNILKPPPVLATDRTHAQNLDALRRHFQSTLPVYGPLTVINLAEQHNKEGPITQSYREYMEEAELDDVQYCEYDFHMETRGMKYENIQKLNIKLDRVFESQGYHWISNNIVLSRQKGVYRVNCIDCLDRTNVVQSAFARYVLNRQLGAVALLNPDVQRRTATDIVVNDLWANNGDAISRAYAGTSALKGDFTRTGKRDLTGLLNDGMNSLARMYTATFSDWFCQAVIDFLLGNRNLSVFSEFLNRLQSTDPRDLIRISKIRQEAIATSASRVLPEGEAPLHGWTLFAPGEFNAKVADKFEEKILLLTGKALYIVSYDYNLEKVKAYTRVLLGDIVGISKGAYILSPLEEASRDPTQNYGFIISWHSSRQMTRITSYSVRNTVDTSMPPTAEAALSSSPPRSLSSISTVDSSPTPSTFTIKESKAPPKLARRSNTAAAIMVHRDLITEVTRKGLQNLSRKSSMLLSTYLNNAAKMVADTDVVYAAFKVLPIDPAAIPKHSTQQSVTGVELPDREDVMEAKSCEEAADMMVDSIRGACRDAGNAPPGFVVEEAVVSLAEAHRMTSVYAKMEYGVKRLLWLGG